MILSLSHRFASGGKISRIAGCAVQFVDDEGDPAFPYVYLEHDEIVMCLKSDGRFSMVMRANGAIGQIMWYNCREVSYVE